MSEWNRDRRDMRPDTDRDRYSGRSSPGRDERWTSDRQGGEARSFGGGQDYGSGDSGQDYGGQTYGERTYGGAQSYGQGYGQNAGERSYGDRSYGADSRWTQGDRQSRDPWRDTWRDQPGDRQTAQQRGQQSSRQGAQQSGGAFTARNEVVQHVTDGDADHGMWSMFGHDHGRGEHRGRGPKNYTRSDDRIREDVNDRLTHDSRVDASEIDVQVSQGEITLTGAVNSREDKRIAEDIAEQVSGVKHVQNNLRVQAQGGQSTMGQSTTGQTGMSASGADKRQA